ncbi:Efflux pump periplasmic linker BepF [invertebrate metagenome]|uniref:Efflux pump periplasmic linker BepF n=1 Tax=invertebrate metagenome TaxID=1711999 RepID=A0A2H9TAX6_9ZZZZ
MISASHQVKSRARLAVGALLASVLMLSGCSEEKQQAMPAPGVSVIAVQNEAVGDYQEFVARAEAVDQVNLMARVEGFLTKRNFTEGQPVRKEQLLFEIDPKPYIADLKKAEADLASSKAELIKAKKDLVRIKDLFNKGHVSQSDLDTQVSTEAQALASVKAAEAGLDTAQLNLGYTQVKAPFDGKIGKARYSTGNLVGPGSDPLATVSSVDPIYVTFQVNEKQLVDHIQQSGNNNGDKFRLTLRLPNGQDYGQDGTFNFADTTIDQTTGTLTLRAQFPNKSGLLYPGLYVTLMTESKDKQQMPVIPQFAVQENQSGRFVLVVGENNTAAIRQVEMGRRIGPMWAVKSGLKIDEKVVVEGLQKVKAGAKVRPSPVTIDHQTGAIIRPQPQSTGQAGQSVQGK